MRLKGTSATLKQRRREAVAILKQGVSASAVANGLRTTALTVLFGCGEAGLSTAEERGGVGI